MISRSFFGKAVQTLHSNDRQAIDQSPYHRRRHRNTVMAVPLLGERKGGSLGRLILIHGVERMIENTPIKRHRGAQPGNKNAKGNRGNSRPRPNYGNRGALVRPPGISLPDESQSISARHSCRSTLKIRRLERGSKRTSSFFRHFQTKAQRRQIQSTLLRLSD